MIKIHLSHGKIGLTATGGDCYAFTIHGIHEVLTLNFFFAVFFTLVKAGQMHYLFFIGQNR
jgi:hypothetical protein